MLAGDRTALAALLVLCIGALLVDRVRLAKHAVRLDEQLEKLVTDRVDGVRKLAAVLIHWKGELAELRAALDAHHEKIDKRLGRPPYRRHDEDDDP